MNSYILAQQTQSSFVVWVYFTVLLLGPNNHIACLPMYLSNVSNRILSTYGIGLFFSYWSAVSDKGSLWLVIKSIKPKVCRRRKKTAESKEPDDISKFWHGLTDLQLSGQLTKKERNPNGISSCMLMLKSKLMVIN